VLAKGLAEERQTHPPSTAEFVETKLCALQTVMPRKDFAFCLEPVFVLETVALSSLLIELIRALANLFVQIS
jgi:hypothetical protein